MNSQKINKSCFLLVSTRKSHSDIFHLEEVVDGPHQLIDLILNFHFILVRMENCLLLGVKD